MRAIDCLVRPHYLITIYQFYIFGLFRWNSYTHSFILREYTVVMYFHSILTPISHKLACRTSPPLGELLDCSLVVVGLYSQCGTSAQSRMIERWTENPCVELHVANRCCHPKIEAHVRPKADKQQNRKTAVAYENNKETFFWQLYTIETGLVGEGALVAAVHEVVALGPRPWIVWSSMISIDSGMVRTVANELIELEVGIKLQR